MADDAQRHSGEGQPPSFIIFTSRRRNDGPLPPADEAPHAQMPRRRPMSAQLPTRRHDAHASMPPMPWLGADEVLPDIRRRGPIRALARETHHQPERCASSGRIGADYAEIPRHGTALKRRAAEKSIPRRAILGAR